jgi:hypothetical protein
VLSTTEGMISPFSLPMGKNSGKSKFKTMLVLEPSVFLDDNTEGWTVVRRRRWSPAIEVKAQDPRKKAVSNFHAMGLTRLRARANSNMNLCGPISAREGVSIERRSGP